MAQHPFSYDVYDMYFESLGRCMVEDYSEIFSYYPSAYYILCTDYVTREKSFHTIPILNGPNFVKHEHIQSLKKDGGYLGIDGHPNTFAILNEDGTIRKVSKRQFSKHYDFVNLIDVCRKLCESGQKCYAMLSKTTVYNNELARRLGKIIEDDGFYGGDIAIRFEQEEK